MDIVIDGQPFTSYLYPASLKKPVLFPIRTAAGTAEDLNRAQKEFAAVRPGQ